MKKRTVERNYYVPSRISFKLLKTYGLFLLICSVFSACVPFSKDLEVNESFQLRNSDGFRHLLDAVVRIDVSEKNFSSGAMRIQRGVGSGVIMTAEGHVLTNAHVVSPKASDISVTLSNLERVDAKLIGWDHWTDLALLQLDMEDLESRGLSFTVASFGDSSGLQAGDTVMAVGTPHGLSRTVTKGIISNPKRYFSGSDSINGYETGYFNTWLQTDAAINPGNSGGPLVNQSGAVIGINTRSYLGANSLGFAVPASTAEYVMEALRLHGEVQRSYIGIKPGPMQDLESFFELESNTGVLVDSVDPGSPAALVGLRAGDIILEIDGVAVDGRFPEQLPPILNQVAQKPISEEIVLKLKDFDSEREVRVRTEALESRMGEQMALAVWGITIQKMSKAIARERRLASSDGAIVIGVQSAFPGAKAGLYSGDIITSLNREAVLDLDQLEVADSLFEEKDEDVLLQVNRSHRVKYVVIKP